MLRARGWILTMGVCGLAVLGALAARGADDDEEEKKPEGKRRGQMSEEQKAVRKEMLEKYDKNKNGKIDDDERKQISAADKEKLTRVGLGAVTPRRRREEAPPRVPVR